MKRAFLAIAAAILAMQNSPAESPAQEAAQITGRDRAVAAACGAATPRADAAGEAPFAIVVDPATQRLVLWRNGEPLCAFPVSTAKAGLGCRDGSGRTPTGWHRVAEWIGSDALPGQVFVSREPTGEVLPQARWRSDADDDKVLTRILWLDGLQPGVNSGPGVDSHDRFIYIHGTSQEHLIGTPASHGCIRMTNHDVMRLFHYTYGHETLCFIAGTQEGLSK